jgi:hypothetical protein
MLGFLWGSAGLEESAHDDRGEEQQVPPDFPEGLGRRVLFGVRFHDIICFGFRRLR